MYLLIAAAVFLFVVLGLFLKFKLINRKAK